MEQYIPYIILNAILIAGTIAMNWWFKRGGF